MALPALRRIPEDPGDEVLFRLAVSGDGRIVVRDAMNDRGRLARGIAADAVRRAHDIPVREETARLGRQLRLTKRPTNGDDRFTRVQNEGLSLVAIVARFVVQFTCVELLFLSRVSNREHAEQAEEAAGEDGGHHDLAEDVHHRSAGVGVRRIQ